MTKINGKILGMISVVVFLVFWETVARFEIIRPIFIGTPTEIIKELVALFSSGKIFPYLINSLQSLVFGLILSILLGAIGGIVIGSSNKLYDITKPFIYSLTVIPKIAIIPLIIIWFGIGLNAKVFIIVFMSVVPILIATIDSVKSLDKNILSMARSFQADKIFIIKNITFFHALPSTFSGIRIALGRAIMGLLVAEIFGLGKGIGYLVSFYGASYQTDKLMALILLVIILNFLLLKLIDFTENKIIKWEN